MSPDDSVTTQGKTTSVRSNLSCTERQKNIRERMQGQEKNDDDVTLNGGKNHNERRAAMTRVANRNCNLRRKPAPVADFAEAFSAGVLEQSYFVARMFELMDVGPDFGLP